TELAYKVVYREQGFVPADETKAPDEPVEPIEGSTGEGVDADGAADKNGSNEPDTGEAQTAKRRRKSE
ncbi:hypothetical protein, partial [Anaerovibrio sp.]|uniref:hypothetical protein n=1 Tax=Anaerovibrio sp. TaxID=1872532 RepID=UPI003F153DA7